MCPCGFRMASCWWIWATSIDILTFINKSESVRMSARLSLSVNESVYVGFYFCDTHNTFLNILSPEVMCSDNVYPGMSFRFTVGIIMPFSRKTLRTFRIWRWIPEEVMTQKSLSYGHVFNLSAAFCHVSLRAHLRVVGMLRFVFLT